MKTYQYKCDVCGSVRGEGNHWMTMVAPTHSSPYFMSWSDAASGSSTQHICSAKCAHLMLDRWITETQKQSHAA